MRVALVFDMEGVAHIGDVREPYPTYCEYWETGRGKLADDVVAATKGLLAGGASEVLILNHHGAGETDWPNLILDRLPDGASLVEDWGTRKMRERVDAMLQVGAHARAGRRSFLAHTICPGLRLRVGDELLSESHWWAWTGDVPVFGIVGSEELGADLREGRLRDVPFLAVQRSEARDTAAPVFGSPAETAAAIEDFATDAARRATDRRAAAPDGPIRLETSLLNAEHVVVAMTEAGWARTTRTAFAIESDTWRSADERIDNAIWAAAGAAWEPYSFCFDGLDPSSRESALAYPADRLADVDAVLRSWSTKDSPEWFEPADADGPLEGLDWGDAGGGTVPAR